MTRTQKFALFLTLAIIGSLGIALSTFLVVRPAHNAVPGTIHIVVGTLIVAFAMAWAMFFAMRAHSVPDEFKRQREISAGYWGGSMGLAASAPIFFLIACVGFLNPAAMRIPPLMVFTVGYILSPICWGIGAVGAGMWRRHFDNRQ